MTVETQTQILTHLSNGLTASEIAAKTGLKTKTVEKYKEILQAAYGAKNAVELVAKAIRAKDIK